MIDTATLILVYIAFIGFSLKRLMTYMHVLQQEDYDIGRLFKWIGENKVFDKRLSAILVLLGAAWFFAPPFIIRVLVFVAFALITYVEKDPRKNSKKKLVATARAKRIYFPAFILMAGLGTTCFTFSMPWIWIIHVQLMPFVLALVTLLLMPYEDIVQKKFWNEAHNKIQNLRPTVIGITGSFGKTSVKHILGHILKASAPTLITPGSVNTPMGITRIIREQLEETHRYLVVEMGAYGPGSIERLCRLTPPDMGIITSIGYAHYERFKSLETVAKTKYELAEAVLKKNGMVVVHERTLRFDYSREMKLHNAGNFIVCGEAVITSEEKSYLRADDLQIQRVDQSPKGLQVKILWKNVAYTLEAPLYGLHHGHNIALAFAAAMELGIPSGTIQTALMRVPQIEHRLEVKKQAGYTLIDDAYNSNPQGFTSALDVLALISKGRKILITPGMVELGNAHDNAHENVGKYAGQICDIAIVVTSKRIPSFIKGFKATGGSKQLIEVEGFKDAAEWLDKNKKDGDVVLIENDLPDMYERVPKI
jgi:UDP-N-acetylmuramoyl-tripeptide--D-alanyl-D-alanine ligase